VEADATLTTDACTQACDAVFVMVDDTDEAHTDELCKNACTTAIDHMHAANQHNQHNGQPAGN